MGEESPKPASTPTGAVFLSYASQDAVAAQKICDALRAAGIEVWFDQSELRGGDAWDHKIRDQIHDCRLFVPVISANTERRDEGYFRREWSLAVDRTRDMVHKRTFLVPVVIDGTPERGAAVPEKFHELQWTRLPGGEAPPSFVDRIRRLLTPDLASATTEATPSRNRSTSAPWARRPTSSKTAIWGASAIAAVACAYFVADKFWISKPTVLPARLVALTAPQTIQSADTAAPFNPPPHSIAVLPFTNLSGDPKQEYFSDGMTEELINALAQIDSLLVTARTSSFSFKDQPVDIGIIAHKLNVAAVLEGSIRRSGNTVRITAQLINGVNGFHVWSHSYDRDLNDALALETDIATQVAQELQAKLLGTEAAKIEAGGTHNPQAYDAYLHAQQLTTGADSAAEFAAALQAADQAIASDPNYAAAYALRAHVLRDTTIWETEGVKVRNTFDLARQAAEHAVALAPDFADGHLVLGWHVLAMGFLDLVGAAREINRGVALAPGSATSQDYLSGLEMLLDHRHAAFTAMSRAIHLDPQNYKYRVHMVFVLYSSRRFAEVPDAVHDADALKPRGHIVRHYLVRSYLALKRYDLARQACESAATPLDEDDRHFCLTLAYGAVGDSQRADGELEKLKAVDPPGGSPSEYAAIYAQRGDKRSALHFLAKAEVARDLSGLRIEWMLDPIRSEPEFKALERRLNFPP